MEAQGEGVSINQINEDIGLSQSSKRKMVWSNLRGSEYIIVLYIHVYNTFKYVKIFRFIVTKSCRVLDFRGSFIAHKYSSKDIYS
jgi:hypothetical protein